jgi:hypothetical protein
VTLVNGRRARARAPVFVGNPNGEDQSIIRSALEAEGFRCYLGLARDDVPNIQEHPLAVIDSTAAGKIAAWADYVERGGVLIFTNPEPSSAHYFGFGEYEGLVHEGVLFLATSKGASGVPVQIFGNISKFSSVAGLIHARFSVAETSCKKYPGIVEMSRGRGKILIITFSLGRVVNYFRQRTREVGNKVGTGSAERIALAGVDKKFCFLPQLDLLLGFLSRFISSELTRANSPSPRFGSVPGGFRSLLIFSFDDVSPSGKPVRRALSQLISGFESVSHKSHQEVAIFQSIKGLLKALIHYPWNYQDDVQALIELFTKYDTAGSVFVLPNLGWLKNRVPGIGYRGFSRKTFKALKEAGWDIGTHIKPAKLADYQRVRRKFKRRFRSDLYGHRGHELGWIGWDEDWQQLETLGYMYDSTWNWGGHGGLAWILGTGYPFHPVDRHGEPLEILELPTVGWIDDLYQTPERSVETLADALDKYPGIYHLAGHSWKLRDRAYYEFVESVLRMGLAKGYLGVGLNLAEVCKFWKLKEKSDFYTLHWDRGNKIVSFIVVSPCNDNDLAIYMPYHWGEQKVYAVLVNGAKKDFSLQEQWGMTYAVMTSARGETSVAVQYA